MPSYRVTFRFIEVESYTVSADGEAGALAKAKEALANNKGRQPHINSVIVEES